MNIRYDRFDQGKRKALVMSYDDGRVFDRPMVDLLNRYGIRGTFHLNSGFLNRPNFVSGSELRALYADHEVAAHTAHHPFLDQLPPERIVGEIVEDRKALEAFIGYPVVGFSYPFGAWNEQAAAYIRSAGIEYARTTACHGQFTMPENALAWGPTCHHRDMLEYGKRLLELEQRHSRMALLYIYGHSYEFDRDRNWELLETFCDMIGGRDDIWYVTNGELAGYMAALRRLRFSASGEIAFNPSAVPVWFSLDGEPVELRAGETKQLSAAVERQRTARTKPTYSVRLETARSGFTETECWVHSRAGVLHPKGRPDDRLEAVMTLQKLTLSGSDVFGQLHQMRFDGTDWDGPVPMPGFEHRPQPDGARLGLSDFTPAWHAASGRLLGTGHTVLYRNGELVPGQRRATGYSLYDSETRRWSPWRELNMPPRLGNTGAGSTQRTDLPNGDILLPVYGRLADNPHMFSTVVRCRLEGDELRVVEQGSELTLGRDRGYYEPSLAAFDGHYYLTLRADDRGAVARSDDGLHFGEPLIWTWDDGAVVPIYNTQQHWVAHSDGLFLVYTRKAENNDHVFRHRAPLFMAEVDTERLCLIRSSERILIPENGARLCNFGVTHMSAAETWITVCEWMQPIGCERYGSDNRLHVVRICWNRPNRLPF